VIVSDLIPEKAEELGYQELKGALVVYVSPESPLYGHLLPDDLILQINHYNIQSARDFNQVSAKLHSGQLVRIYYRRGEVSMFFAFRLSKK